jgi:hypothetical protein
MEEINEMMRCIKSRNIAWEGGMRKRQAALFASQRSSRGYSGQPPMRHFLTFEPILCFLGEEVYSESWSYSRPPSSNRYNLVDLGQFLYFSHKSATARKAIKRRIRFPWKTCGHEYKQTCWIGQKRWHRKKSTSKKLSNAKTACCEARNLALEAFLRERQK